MLCGYEMPTFENPRNTSRYLSDPTEFVCRKISFASPVKFRPARALEGGAKPK